MRKRSLTISTGMTTNEIVKILVECFKRRSFVYLIGCGGSASMASHTAGEFLGRFEKERRPLPAIALTDPTFITAWSNDYDFSDVFRRQVEAFGKRNDVLIAFSTSGKSISILEAIDQATKQGMIVVDFPRKGKGTANIQNNQLALMHEIVREVEKEFA